MCETLEKEADTLSLEAEKKENIQTLSNANALRSKAKTKTLKHLDEARSVRLAKACVLQKIYSVPEKIS